MLTTAHRFRFFDSTVDLDGNPSPQWDSYFTLTINPIAYDGFGDKNLNEVDTLFEAQGTLIEEPVFDYRAREMTWHNMAKFKYFDEEHGVPVGPGLKPQFMHLASMEFHRSGKYFWLDDRGYTTAINLADMRHPLQVYIMIRVDALKIDGFAKVPAPYFNTVKLEYTPIATLTERR